MSGRYELPDAADLAAAAEVTRAQRDLELSLLAAEARTALELALPLLALLPPPAVAVVEVLRRIVARI